MSALTHPFFLDSLVKKLTVSGIIGNTHGVNRAKNPPKNPNMNIKNKLSCFITVSPHDATGSLYVV